MKSLTLLRHAKSSWDDRVQRDFERPLNARGRRAAVAIGAFMAREGLTFDFVLASPAQRVCETIDGVGEGLGRPLGATFEPRIYMATAATLLDLVHDLPASAARVLLVGHNPGLEDLVLLLTTAEGAPRGMVEEKYPTAALAELSSGSATWSEIAERGATLERFTRPRDLDPALGPDED